MKHALWITLLCAALGACADDPTTDPTKLTFSTGDFEIPVGDSFTCFYTDVYSDRELSVRGADGQQGLGGHHIVAYYADTPRPVGHHPCTDEEMTNLHQIAAAGSSDSLEGPLELHDDLALKIVAGKQFVLQAHYVNVTEAPMVVNDTVSLRLMDPAQVRAYVNYFVTNDTTFQVPQNTTYTHTTYCTLQRDLDVVLTLGHLHEDGQRYRLEVVDGSDAPLQMLRDDTWQPSFTSHPPVTYYPADAPLRLAAGTRLRQTCEWDNRTARTLIFPSEMCLSFMYYFPGTGEDITCAMANQ